MEKKYRTTNDGPRFSFVVRHWTSKSGREGGKRHTRYSLAIDFRLASISLRPIRMNGSIDNRRNERGCNRPVIVFPSMVEVGYDVFVRLA